MHSKFVSKRAAGVKYSLNGKRLMNLNCNFKWTMNMDGNFDMNIDSYDST